MKRLFILLIFCALPAFAQSGSLSSAGTACIQNGLTPNCLATLRIAGNISAAAFSIAATPAFSATVQFEGTVDGVTWTSLAVTPLGGGASVTSATATGTWQTTMVAGLIGARMRVSTRVSGTVAAQINLSTAAALPASPEAGTIACSTSTATITFKKIYLNVPHYVIQDRTTSGPVTQTSESTTTLVVGCPGASDNLNYIITP